MTYKPSINPFDITGKVALITGSTMGLGQAIARVLAEHGAQVIISSRKQDDCDRVAASFREQNLLADAKACNIGTMEDIADMYRYIDKHFGRLDILVNNAVLSPWRTIEDTDPLLFMKAVEVDLRGYWYMSTAAVKRMRNNGGGSIVNMSSMVALHPDHMLSLYSTLKAALIGMSRSFALEFGKDSIRVNSILPGIFPTKLADAYDEETQRRMLDKILLGRFGSAEEIGYAVLYLSSAAGAYVTGTNLVIDGGFTVSLL